MISGRVKHLKRGDNVVALSGSHKGRSGKVLEVNQGKALVKIDGLGVVKKHTKPSQANPKGGIIDMNRWLPACKFQLCDDSGKALGRVGFKMEGSDKKRVSTKAKK